MLRRTVWTYASVLVVLTGTVALGARIRPGGDPRPDRVIWADPFDNYSQWAEDNNQIWQGGPVPAGSTSGTYPSKGPNPPGNGCGVTWQYPGFALARAQWVSNDCPSPIVTPAGYPVVDPTTLWAQVDDFVPGSDCKSGGWVETISMYGRYDGIWQSASSWHSPLGMFTHDLVPRIQSWVVPRAWDEANPNAANGTDAHPLTLIFYLDDTGAYNNARSLNNNSYVELNLDDEHAPTDYIWRGNRNLPYPEPECCPEGPYPIICQQVRELNQGNFEQQTDVNYLNDHCPSLVLPYDPETGTGKTWSAIAFGFLAIGCKDPCTCEEQGEGSHRPTMNHPMLFNGNVWRELRNNRGTGLTECPPSWGPGPPWELLGPETTMQDSGTGACDDFSLAGGTHIVYLKLTTNRILIWMNTRTDASTYADYCGAFPRIYTGPFNRISWGVGPGCELKDKATQGDEYACKPGGTPTQCLTYSGPTNDGYWRNNIDSMNLLDGVLVHNTSIGACCDEKGACSETEQSACTGYGKKWDGPNKTCGVVQCFPYPFADADTDGDVDQADFAVFQRCYTGPTGGVPDECKVWDRDGDQGGIGTGDFTAFSSCWSGPNVKYSELNPPPPSCLAYQP